jgi:hypothetical protein
MPTVSIDVMGLSAAAEAISARPHDWTVAMEVLDKVLPGSSPGRNARLGPASAPFAVGVR